MFARIATFEGVDMSTAPQALEQVRERATSIVEALPGWQGAMQLVDEDSGKVMVIHLFDTQENMQAAEPTFEEMPRRLGPELAQQVAGKRRSVERFKVLAERRRGD